MSVPLTSSWAKQKSVCFQQTERYHMCQNHARQQEDHTGAGGVFTAGPLSQNNVLDTKLQSVALT